MKSVYIHIPFCKTICSYCDFSKMLYCRKWINAYLEQLKKEIKINYQNDIIETIYIGGGTPNVLSNEELIILMDIVNVFKRSIDCEITFECNIELINEKQIEILKHYGVNRISIGIQTFNPKHLKFLNRHHTVSEVFEKITLLKKKGFNNINVDLIYGLKNQTLKELEYDIDQFLKLGVNHISTYSLMIEPNTKIYIDKCQNIDEQLDYNMYQLICNKLKENSFIHYEVSNFSKDGYFSRHNLTYWNNMTYYGFGLGAGGYVLDFRYTNTRNLNKYLNGNYVSEKEMIDLNTKLQNEFILGFRKIDGISKQEFLNKYQFDIHKIDIINTLIKQNKLQENEKKIFINEDYIYISNQILVEFLIDFEVENG